MPTAPASGLERQQQAPPARSSAPAMRADISSCGFEIAKWLPVFFVWFLILSLYGIYMGFHLVPALEKDSNGWLVTKAIFFNTVFFGLVLCYICSIVIHPGSIPTKEDDPTGSWVYASLESQGATGSDQLQNLETKRTGDRRNCKWCWKYKPDRCHHCRVCRTCILRMDHHCPWIFNCVGFRNHKYFFLLLVYAATCCHIILWTMMLDVLEVFDKDKLFMEIFCLLFGETLAVFLGVLVTLFLGFHIWLMLKAITTIEFCEKQSKKGSFNVTAYDRGIYGNICAVLGDNPLLWLLPCSLPSGDGLSFVDEAMPLKNDMETGRTSAHLTATSASASSHNVRGQQPGSSTATIGADGTAGQEGVRAVAGTGSAPDSPSRRSSATRLGL